jgi:pSer/pThr/pTyr-binding forkhead associated (FHA) protein
MPIQIIVTDESGNEIYKLPIKDKVSLGRLDSCDYTIDDKKISKVHCTIEVTKAGKVLFSDNDSTNGSKLHGFRIKDVELKIGDKVKIGNHSIQIDVSKLTIKEKQTIGKADVDTGITLPKSTISKTASIIRDKINKIK